jgi:HSP20 family protein
MATQNLTPWERNGGRDRNLPAQNEPGGSLFTFHREMNRLFDDFFRGFDTPALQRAGGGIAMGWPKLEVEETDNEYRVHAELPGIDPKDVEVTLQDGMLVLRGEKRAKIEDPNRAVSERFYGRFERRIPLEGVDEDRIQANFENGVLTITAPRSAQAHDKTKRIEIKSNAPSQQGQATTH